MNEVNKAVSESRLGEMDDVRPNIAIETEQGNSQLSQNPLHEAPDTLNETEATEHFRVDENARDTVSGPDNQPDIDYQPTTEQIEAAQLFDEFNNDNIEFRELTEEERADAELAVFLQAQEDANYNSDNDVDAAPEVYECACGDSFTWQEAMNMVYLNCGHVRCNDCLNQNVSVGLSSKRRYPPHCCGVAIEVELVQDNLSDDNILRWVAVKDEYEDHAPIYCAIKTCSVYLPKDTLDLSRKWATCLDCGVKTCSGCLCLESDHITSNECPERMDKMDRELMARKRWKPCPGCKHMIERIEGCDHMTCDCGKEFCYRCGKEYEGGMPCNCHGQRQWVEEDAGAANPAMQQQILNNLTEEAGDERAAVPQAGQL